MVRPSPRPLSRILLLPLLVTAPVLAQASVRLESLDLAGFEQDWGNARAARSVDGHPLRIGTVDFVAGVGTHANGEVAIDLGGAATTFSAEVGVDAEVGARGSVVFVVLVDGAERFRSAVRRGGDAPVPVRVGLAGAKTLTLAVEDGGDGIDYDHADWADAAITLAPGATAAAVHVAVVEDAAMPIAMGHDDHPHVNHPRRTGASPHKPFLFRIPASGRPPLRFEVAGLPPGVSLDAANGVLRGELQGDGEWPVSVKVANELGEETRTLTIVGRPGAIALTPPLGWNSWNCWALAIDDGKVRAAADAFVATGLAAHGFAYVNIDDGWEKDRDAQGRIRTNERFPDMPALSHYVHERGLKLGIYSSPGPKTCGGYEGSWQHEVSDARTWADWGIDYLKYDWCSYGDLAPKPDLAALQKPYAVMRDALRSGPRDVVYSLCQYGMGDVWTWGKDVDGNCWRTTGDITDSWSSMAGIGFAHTERSPHAGPGRWNDPDMLVVGRVGWGPSLHPSRLTHNEQITHVTLWAMLAAPLLIGCDLGTLDDFTLALLTNDDVLAIDQDPLGRAARRLGPAGATEVWTRPLLDGSTAVALCNRSRQPATVKVAWRDLGRSGPQPVRDCWQRRDEGNVPEGYEAIVPRHGAVLLRVGAIGADAR